jgi:hypothetical membrane protein
MARKILLTCGIVSSAWYLITDVIGTLRYPGYRYTEQQFSELTATGSPVRPFMIALNEFPYNVLVAAFAGGVWTSAEPKRAGRITGAMLIGYALSGMVTGVFFPMKRREALAAGEGTLRNAMHPPGTIVMSLFIVLAMSYGARLLGRRFLYYSYGTIAILIVFGVLTSLQVGRMEANQPTPWMGVTERINIYATMLWVAVLAIGHLRAQETR